MATFNVNDNQHVDVLEDDSINNHASSDRNEKVYNDADSDITNGRWIQRWMVRKGYTWYYDPERSQKDSACGAETGSSPTASVRGKVANLDAGWAYFEHVALPRKLIYDDDGDYHRSEKKTLLSESGKVNDSSQLYPYFSTTIEELEDFGVGVAMLFYSMRSIIALCLFLGVIYIGGMIAYSSEYRDTDDTEGIFNFRSETPISDIVPEFYDISAVCNRVTFVYCEDCKYHENDFPDGRLYKSTDGEEVYVAVKNQCDAALDILGSFHVVAIAVVAISQIVLAFLYRAKEQTIDDENFTTKDFSVVVADPPNSSADPQVWYDFFEKQIFSDGSAESGEDNDRVIFVTVSLNNEELIYELVKRKAKIHHIMVETGEDVGLMDKEDRLQFRANIAKDLSPFQTILNMLGLYKTLDQSVDIIEECEGNICKLMMNEQYEPTNVFVSFRTMKLKERVLDKLAVSGFDALLDNKEKIEDCYRFGNDEAVLDVQEAGEPKDVRWLDLSYPLLNCILRTTLLFIPVFGVIVVSGIIANRVRSSETATSLNYGLTISTLNIVGPVLMKIINSFEKHQYESFYQASLFAKITLFRWVNTAIITTILNTFASSVDQHKLISDITGVFVAEIFTTPLLTLCDFAGQFKRHFLGPRQKNQYAMNNTFKGQAYNLAERYTNVSKLFFLCTWYGVLYPIGYVLAALALSVQYFADKFLLLRTWARRPPTGPHISTLSRKVFFPLIFLSFSVISSYHWSGFPYDNLCESDKAPPAFIADGTYSGSFKTVRGPVDDTALTKTATPKIENLSSTPYKYCVQDYLGRPGSESRNRFPAVPDNNDLIKNFGWMTRTQEVYARILGWSSIAALCFVIIFLIRNSIIPYLKKFFSVKNINDGVVIEESEEELQNYQEGHSENDFYNCAGLESYIPNVSHKDITYPLTAVKLDLFEENETMKKFVGWRDPLATTYDETNLVKDAQDIVKLYDLDVNVDKSFGSVKYFGRALK